MFVGAYRLNLRKMSGSNSGANDQLIRNLENQLERLVEQLTDLEECKADLSTEEYDQMKEETVDQIKEFTATLDRMNKGDVTLDNKFSQLRQSIRTAIATAFNTTEMRRMFGDQNAQEMETQLAALDQAYQLKRITVDNYERQRFALLVQLQEQGHRLCDQDRMYFETHHDRLYQRMEQVVDDEAAEELGA